MRGLRLWGVLTGEVSCPPRPVLPVVPTQPTPLVLAATASQADKDAAMVTDVVAVRAYEQKVEYDASLTATSTERHIGYPSMETAGVRRRRIALSARPVRTNLTWAAAGPST